MHYHRRYCFLNCFWYCVWRGSRTAIKVFVMKQQPTVQSVLGFYSTKNKTYKVIWNSDKNIFCRLWDHQEIFCFPLSNTRFAPQFCEHWHTMACKQEMAAMKILLLSCIIIILLYYRYVFGRWNARFQLLLADTDSSMIQQDICRLCTTNISVYLLRMAEYICW